MIFNAENILLIGSVLIFVSILVSKASYRFGVPTLLLFLLVGMLFGSDGLGIEFHSAADAQFIGMIALSIILFSGGMDTKLQEIRPVLFPGIVLSSLGVLATTILTGLFIFFLSDHTDADISLTLLVSMLLAATMSSTDSASVFNLLRSQRMNLKHNLRPMLELESGSNDPMAYMLTIVLIQVVGSGSELSIGVLLKDLFLQFLFGGVIGYAAGRFAGWLINKINLSNSSLYPILLLSIVFMTFTLTDTIRGNGYLAVYIAGVVIGNMRLAYRKETNTFMNGMTWLSQIIVFLTLGLLVNPHEMLKVAPVALLIGVFMILVARPLSVFISLAPFRSISVQSKLFTSWVGLRGAAPIIFATYPVVENVQGADLIFNIVFFITLVSLVVQGSSIPASARMFRLNEEMDEEENTFGIEVPEEAGKLVEISLTEESLLHGDTLKELKLPEGMLVMMIKREGKFIVPNGSVKLRAGDRLLIISDNAGND